MKHALNSQIDTPTSSLTHNATLGKTGSISKPRGQCMKDAIPAQTLNDLLDRIGQQQDKTAFIQLFDLMAGRLKYFAMQCSASAEDAEEIVQESMLIVWNKAHTFNRHTASASTWMYTIVRNKRIDFARKKRPDQIYSSDLFPEVASETLETDMAEAQTQQETTALLEHLPVEQRQIIYKAYFQNQSHSQIAQEMDVPLGTVKSRVRLALKKLNSLLEGSLPCLIIILMTNF